MLQCIPQLQLCRGGKFLYCYRLLRVVGLKSAARANPVVSSISGFCSLTSSCVGSTAEASPGHSSISRFCGLAAEMGRGARGVLIAPLAEEKLEAKPRAITPLPVPRVSDLKQFDGEHRERLFWGTYRPFAYLGIRSRTPESLIAGLMWAGVSDGQDAIRHYCEDGDNLTRWSWLRHDGSSYGRQVLVDQGLMLTTYFLKSTEPGSGYGGDWVVRLKIEQLDESVTTDGTHSVFFYVGEEGGKPVNLFPERGYPAKEGPFAEDGPFAGGYANEVGSWQMHAKYEKGMTMNYAGVRQLSFSNLAEFVHSTLQEEKSGRRRFQLPDTSVSDANVGIIQLTGAAPFQADIVFVSGVDQEAARVESRVDNLTGSMLDTKIMERELAFDQRFQETFRLNEKVDGEKELETARVALSNMLGGIGYFYGQTRVSIPPDCQEADPRKPDYWLYWPTSLFTAVPSRSIFPRGFLWDEGFHQLLISPWDRNISMEIIANWFDLVNIDGWIPREQILGEEAISKTPPAYINQYTNNANPPALLLILRRLAQRFEEDKKKGLASVDDEEFFKTIYPRASVWYNWYNTTQTGKEPDSYYWHGRETDSNELNPKCLTSGLDDYPRASHPTDDERHLDLRCWIANAADSMTLLARVAGMPTDIYEANAKRLSDLTRLNELHYDESTGHYYDYGYHSEKVALRWVNREDTEMGLGSRVLTRVVLESPKLGWVPHFGLNSLFPFLMHLIPSDSPILGEHLELLANPDLLWTEFGLRSLATTSSIYMKYNSEFEAPYWRGPVWINLNYLALSALHSYAQEAGPYQTQAATLYDYFRGHLIRNIVQRFTETGYIWENYCNATQGTGQGAHPFTGWSALVVLIMAEMY